MIGATGRDLIFTSIRDESLEWLTRGLNVRISLVSLGELLDPASPVAAVIDVAAGPGDRLRGRHAHPTDAINLVLDGAMYMDGVWLRPGQAKIVPAGTDYGDALAGPEGVRFLEIFARAVGAVPEFFDPEDQAYYQEVHGQMLEALAESSTGVGN
jgi:hypothetical protein